MPVDIRPFFGKEVEEDPAPLPTTVTGNIPDWLKGSFIRTGPGKFSLGDKFSVSHFYDGMAVLLNFNIDGAKATFQRKYLKSESSKKAIAAKKTICAEFGTRSHPDPSKNVIFRALSAIVPGDLTDNFGANVYQLQGKTYTATETCHVWNIDPTTLDSKEKVDLHSLLNVNLNCCHPLVDPDGTAYNLGYTFAGLKYVMYKVPPKQGDAPLANATPIASLSTNWKTCFSYYHSFAMTEKYLIFIEQAMLVDTLKLVAAQLKGKCLHDCMEWTPAEGNRFIVVEKATGNRLATQYVSDAFFMLHHINAFEDDGHIVVDVIAYENANVLDAFYLEKLKKDGWSLKEAAQSKRFVIPLNVKDTAGNQVTLKYTSAKAEQKGKQVFLTGENLVKDGFEFPKINPKLTGRKYKYVYGNGAFDTENHYHNTLTKIDMDTKEVKLWKAGDEFFPGDPVFVPSPTSSSEDDGVILSAVTSVSASQPSFLVVLDAKTLTELGRFTAPKLIPFGLHANFTPK